ncbi:44835_t:CDS:1, partial [Gigaspora margarita]
HSSYLLHFAYQTLSQVQPGYADVFCSAFEDNLCDCIWVHFVFGIR